MKNSDVHNTIIESKGIAGGFVETNTGEQSSISGATVSDPKVRGGEEQPESPATGQIIVGISPAQITFGFPH